MNETAVHIYEEYVKPGSEFQVNLPMTMAKEIKKNIDTDHITVELLDKGQLEVRTSRGAKRRAMNTILARVRGAKRRVLTILY